MLDGWYCRSLANEQAARQDDTNEHVDVDDEDSGSDDSNVQETATNNTVDFKTQYRYLKRKLKFLIYENEFFQDALRSNQRRLLKVSRDRAFLLDRLLQYEKPENTSSESDETESSEDDAKRRKSEQNINNSANGNSTRGRKKKILLAQTTENTIMEMQSEKPVKENVLEIGEQQLGHMTLAEVERHLQSRQPVMELMPERASATVPTEMFSNEPSLDSESNDQILDGSTHVAAEECVPMEYSN